MQLSPSLHPFHGSQAYIKGWRLFLRASVPSGPPFTDVTSIGSFVLLTVLDYFLEDPNLYAPHLFFPAIQVPSSIECMFKLSLEFVFFFGYTTTATEQTTLVPLF